MQNELQNAIFNITKEIAKTSNKVELLQTIHTYILPFFKIESTGLFIINEEENYHYDLTVIYPEIDNSHLNQELNVTIKDHKMAYRGTTIAYHYEQLKKKQQPIIFNFEKDFKKYPHPYSEIILAQGYKETYGALLKSGVDELGILFFNSKITGELERVDADLYQQVADLIAIALSNILGKEKLEKEKQFKETLLSISESIATINNRKELFTTIFKNIAPIIPMDDTAIVILNEDGTEWKDLSNIDHYHNAKASNELAKLGFDGFNKMDDLIKKSLTETAIVTIDQLLEYKQIFAPTMNEAGLKEFMFTPMICQGKTIGSLFFDTKNYNTYSPKYFELFKAIAKMIAIAVTNILSKEEIEEREKEKTNLLAISEAISKSKNTKELLATMREKVMALIPFEDTGILIVEKNGLHHYDLSVNIKGWDDSEANKTLQANAQLQRIEHQGSYLEHVINILEKNNGPIIEDWELAYKKWEHPFFPVVKQFGYKEALVTLLQSGGKTFGSLWLNSKKRENFNKNQFGLFQSIAEQISVAVANILAKEELLEREKEKTNLLAISEAISKSRNATELLATIREKVMALIPFHDTGILIVEKDGLHHYDMAVNIQGWDVTEGNKKLHEMGLFQIPHKGSYVDIVMQLITEKQSPLIEDYQLRIKEFDYPFFDILDEMGYKESLVTTLSTGGKAFGTLWLNSLEKNHFKKGQFNLFQAIADQVSVAVANILAKEEIVEREKEKTKLLEITELIAQIKDTEDLLRLILKKIQPMFNFHDCGLFILSSDKKTHTDYAAVLPDVSPSEWNDMIASVSIEIEHKNSPVEWMMQTITENGKALVFDFKELVEKFPTYPQLDGTGILEMGYRDCLAFNLIVRGEIIGMFCINALQKDFFQPSIFGIFQSVTESISIAVANIIAHEEIQESEKEKTVLLNISNAVSKINSKVDLLKSIDELLWPVFQHADASFCVIDKEQQSFTDYYNLYSKQKTNSTKQDNEKGVIYKEIYKKNESTLSLPGSFVAYAMTKPAMLGKLAEIIPLSTHANLIQTDIEAGLTHYACAPLSVGGKAMGLFMLDFKKQHQPKEKDLYLLTRIADILALAFSNITANEEIIEREKEKDILLNISKKLSKVKKADDVLQIIIQEVKPIFNFFDTGILLIDKSGNGYYDLSVLNPHLDGSSINYQLNEKGYYQSNAIPLTNSVTEWVIEQLKGKVAYIFDYLADYSTFSDVSLLQELKNAGYVKAWISPLVQQGEIFGIFSLNYTNNNNIPLEKEQLFIAVCDRIATSLNNILTNEEIVDREKEKSILLSFSKKIATIRDKNGLLDIVFQDIKLLFPFDSAVFAFYDDTLEHTQHLKNTHNKSYEENEHYNFIMSEKIPTLNSPYGEFIHYKKPTILSLDYLLEKYPNHTGVNIMKDFGLIECVIMPLRYGNKLLATFEMHSYTKGNFSAAAIPIYENLANQLSVTVANILANEEIVEREKEKSILLSISQQISQIRDLDTLINWLHIEANKMHQSEHVMIVLTSPIENTVKLILGEADAIWQQTAGMRPKKGLVNIPTPYRGSIFEHIETLPEGELYAAADLNFPETANFCNTDFQLAESFYVKLIHKGEPIGHISFHTFTKGIFKNIDIGLCKNFANQIAVSLINILDKDAVLERERQKTFEIQINNAVLKNEAFDQVLKDISKSINTAIGCDICYIRIRDIDIETKPFNLFCEKKDDEFITKSRLELLKEFGVKPNDIEVDISNFISSIKEPIIYSGSILEEKVNEISYLSLFKNKLNIHSFIFIPLFLQENKTIHLIVGSKKAFFYIDSDLELLNQVVPQLSLTLENRLAFEQIQKLKEKVETENLYLQEELNENYNFNEIIGSSESLKLVFSQASLVANTDTTVLIGGETGTGKELIARAIHNLSRRKDKIMVKVNCACLPAQLIESELFGHEKGAFTGAIDKRIGKFELANGGTIFLDEIGELPLELQAKLLRVIQEREFERIGGKTVLKTDIRIIAATNKNLELESLEKRFRSDLYYRINVFPISLPALKDRKEDIPLLALHFAQKFAQRMGKKIMAIGNEALQEMMLYNWPGNVRELEHVIEHSVISSKSNKLVLARPLLNNKDYSSKSISDFKLKTLQDNEREHILSILKYCRGRVRGKGGAAQILEIHPNTLESRMIKLGIKKEHTID